MAQKTVKTLATELEKLEQYKEEAFTQREAEPTTITIKVVGSQDIELTVNQKLFFDGLIQTIDTTITQTKQQINDIMFPKTEI